MYIKRAPIGTIIETDKGIYIKGSEDSVVKIEGERSDTIIPISSLMVTETLQQTYENIQQWRKSIHPTIEELPVDTIFYTQDTGDRNELWFYYKVDNNLIIDLNERCSEISIDDFDKDYERYIGTVDGKDLVELITQNKAWLKQVTN